jgi:hypothetical protein
MSALGTRTRAPTVALLALCACLGVARLQPKLARQLHDMKSREDVYVLPPPEQVRTMSLGYFAATVDQLWAKLLVEYGTHHQQKRAFPDLEKYIEAILGVEPTYAPVFKYADTLLVYRPPRGYEIDARTTRNLLERGVKARPYDPDVWTSYGDFLAFVAPSFLPNEDEISKWRLEGAFALEHAVELGAGSRHAVTASALLNRAGERDAAIRQLRRAFSMTDDPEEQEKIGARLDTLNDSVNKEIREQAQRAVDTRHARDLPFASRTLYLLVGPFVDPRRCVGPASVDEKPHCAREWDAIVPSNRP